MKKLTLISALAALTATGTLAQTICTNVHLPGDYFTHEVNPRRTDSRITGKNNPQFGVVSTSGLLRNQLVVFFPGTGGVPATFNNFCENAANLGFHALALTYDNDTSLQNYCGNYPDPDCHYKVRYEILTGQDTTTKTNIGRGNSIEFRLAAMLNYLNTNNPAEGWGQFLVATNTFWSNALAWDRFLLAGHSQGGGFAGFIAKHYEVQRVAMFAGGDFWYPGPQPATWNFLPSATPPERWFQYTHYFDSAFFELAQLETLGQTRYGPPVDVFLNSPPYDFSHTFFSTMEPCPNIFGTIDYHGATVNDPPQVRDTNGVPLNAEVWTHMLIGPIVPPAPANLLADSVADFSSIQNSNNWRYGYYNRTADPNAIYNVADFQPLPTFSNTLFAIPGWVLSNELQVAVWLTGARPHGLNTNACCTDYAAGPELWPVRRWASTVSGPVNISGNLSKWDMGGDGITGMIKLNGVTIWSAFVDGTDIFGTNYSVVANVPPGSLIDFLIVPGTEADHDGARFTGQITYSPPYAPVLYIAPTVDPATLDVFWFASSNHSYYLEQSTNLWTWLPSGLPIRAPFVDSWITNTVATDIPNLFLRLRGDPLTNSAVPTAPGIYSLAMSHDQLARTYRLNIPSAYNPALPAPLMFMLHGGGQTANEIAAMHPALAHHANTNGMILVIPQSTHNQRQTGWSNADPRPGEPYVDDVGFIVSLIDRIDSILNIDRAHVYTAGFSSGGIMSHYLASRTTNVFAAIAACGSSIGGERRMSGVLTTNPPPSGPIAALIINATNDCTRPYYGGYNTDGNYQLPAIDAAYHYTNANFCAGAAVITTNTFMTQNIFRFEACDSKPGPGALQPNRVICHHWQTCAPNTEVVFITLTDGGHLWPDANDNVGFDANLAVIEFFKRH